MFLAYVYFTDKNYAELKIYAGILLMGKMPTSSKQLNILNRKLSTTKLD